MRISDWSSDVCSSELVERARDGMADEAVIAAALPRAERCLAALAELLGERPCFAGADFSLADAQAAPMFHYFLETPEGGQLGRGSCGERVCQYVEISVVAVALKKKKIRHNKIN